MVNEQQLKSKENQHKELKNYPLPLNTVTTIIYNFIIGLFNNMPVLLQIDGNLIQDFHRYGKMPFDWWEKHLSLYSIIDVSLALTSAWITFERSSGRDIFGNGTYFYSSKSGSFEIEVDSNGKLATIFGEFNGKTPSFIPELFKDFPDQEYLSKDCLSDEISKMGIIDDMEFLDGLEPIPFQIIEID